MTEVSRRRLRIAAGVLVVAGVGLLIGTAVVSRSAREAPPVAVPVGVWVPVPERGPFDGGVALYGDPPTRDSPPPQCLTRRGSGTRPVPTSDVSRLDRRVVEEHPVVALLSLDDESGTALRCEGPAAGAATPLYLVAEAGVAPMVPMAGLSLSGLLLVLGLAGVVSLRPLDS